ncbi:hypothetical protein SFR_6248 [Streptomyces sp. FR-008]|nr:hypothetical protein SFR_6248 [Streptomyces sp. FR-008]
MIPCPTVGEAPDPGTRPAGRAGDRTATAGSPPEVSSEG